MPQPHNTPPNFQLLYSKTEITEKIQQLSTEISAWCQQVYESTSKDVLVIPILRGGLFFFADLVREINVSCEIIPIYSVAYDIESNKLLDKPSNTDAHSVVVKERSVLLVDDICETGGTLQNLTETFNKAGVQELRTAVLTKRGLNQLKVEPDWTAFTCNSDDWLVGYGMDDKDRFRNLSGVYKKTSL